ncbi:hypothetical protein [Pseudomonas sp. 2(2015)]|uniref:hypothetical protein n=1 Tax=Pseudomonas sp. 2(2015) TaxID=1619950 RepID=UPI0005EAF539|nr:hypothetical protein [Pseudomonas sp. 2(2015)]KJK15049.1 hypothetical protein UB48_23295 [Pseudomonas sp. 2(2015)]
MSRISIACALPSKDLEIAVFLYQRLKMSISGARQLLASGAQGFFYSADLYGNDHVQCDQDIRDILAFFGQKQLSLLLVETDEGQAPQALDADDLEHCSIAEEPLLNALDACRGLYR